MSKRRILYFAVTCWIIEQPVSASPTHLHPPCKSSTQFHKPMTLHSRDSRMRIINYQPQQVINLKTQVGVVIHLMLEPGERYLMHAFGDAQAYTLVIQDHHLFLKPIAEEANTNLIVITDRRSYNFCLTLQNPDNHTNNYQAALYQIQFHYPQPASAPPKRSSPHASLNPSQQSPPPHLNLNYTRSGDFDVAPSHAWDDGRLTYFKFADHQDLPAIYVVDDDGQESLINRHMTGCARNIVVVHKIHPRWILRLGDRAAAIHNEARSLQSTPNTTATCSPALMRQQYSESQKEKALHRDERI